MPAPETFLLVDGENIDATLGGSLLGRRPAPEERPRWDRVLEHARAAWDQPVRGLFFLNGTTRLPMSFVQALLASHDGDFAPGLEALLAEGGRRVGLIGFRELVSGALSDLSGLEVFDLEDDVGAFTVSLPRVRIIPIERFDPWTLLD